MYKSYSMELAGRTLTVDINRVAKQANGAALMHYGDTTVLATATASKEPREGIDFFPLSVEYEEKMYAVGKIPGGFNKREGKASEHAILTSRVIDRPMRPLFPKDYRNDVTLVNMVMSVDPECNPEIPAMLGSSIATCISDIPFDGPCATTQVGLINGEYIINPTMAQKDVSDLQLTVASTREKVIMIEAGAKEVPEDKMIEAIYKAHEVNQTIIKFIDEIVAEEPQFLNNSWTKEGLLKAVNILLKEKNTLFESLVNKLADYPELRKVIYALLFNGKMIPYNPLNPAIEMAEMFGFIKRENDTAVISNRIFETVLYNYFLSEEFLNSKMYDAALQDKNQFVKNG